MSLVVLNKMSRKTPSQGSSSEWKKKALADPTLGEKDVDLLLYGPKSFAQALRLNVLWIRYRGGS
jgi:hypothetical protein